MLPVTMRQFQVFESVARHLNHSRAAEELYLSQPAVSMQIKQVEEIIGMPLFEQAGKKLFLTEAGREMLHYSRTVLEQLQEMELVFSEMKGLERGHLNIAVVSTANYFMPQLLAKFIQSNAGIQVSLLVGNRDAVLQQITENRADFAIMGLPPEGADILAISFMQNPLVVIATPTHPLADGAGIKPRQLAQETFLFRERGSGTRSVAERYFASHRIPLPNNMEMDTNEAIKLSVQAGMGLGIISQHSIGLELETNRLRVLNVDGFPIVRNWHIVHRRNKRLSVAAQAFEQFLLTEAANLTPLASVV
ncbi:HTH-type transcriptional activator CmpR [Ferriphaselus amnicola]|jgi:DNA-binding transcriptional LysR family regulator|uniref:HTH-type transcriptional activator CmpR n=1 Tax=Ferriphaselus amnicola TaxID=1188319 RepID=A0A2Z6G8H8_9PROT|nr:LysR family transcriptional regulator [Ferriphaselus amnicola]BBE49719.1 HTH-type transcriptional activator CmpR [Ferriphaselus amnicola]